MSALRDQSAPPVSGQFMSPVSGQFMSPVSGQFMSSACVIHGVGMDERMNEGMNEGMLNDTPAQNINQLLGVRQIVKTNF